MKSSIIGIILASGFSKRMGGEKLLLPIENDVVVEKVIKSAITSSLSKVILVYRSNNVGELGDKYGIKAIYNNKAKLGQSESVKLGLQTAVGEGYIFLAGDQPFLSSKTINKMIELFYFSKKGIIIPKFKNTIQMPILFSEKYRKDLMKIKGEKGGFEIIENNKNDIYWYHVTDSLEFEDIDTERQYQEIIARKER